MADAPVRNYAQQQKSALEALLALGTLKCRLMGDYVKDRVAHNFWDGVSANELATAAGYTQGGVAVASPTVTIVDDAAATAWVAGTAYKVGDLRRPTVANGYVYRCVVAGTSHAVTEPTWPTTRPGEEVTDGTVTWELAGVGYVMLDSATDPSWTASGTLTGYSAIFVVDTGVASTSPIVSDMDFGGALSASDADLTVQLPAHGIVTAIIAAR